MSAVVGSREHQKAIEARMQDTLQTMDVVDELRHRAAELEKLSQGDDAQLKSRLAEIYRAQGIEVSDAVLEAGIRARREERFTYVAPKGLSVSLAKAWINRLLIAKVSAMSTAAVMACLLLWQVAVVWPHERAVLKDIATLNSAMASVPSQVGDLNGRLDKALVEFSQSRGQVKAYERADRLATVVQLQSAAAGQGESKVRQALVRLDTPALPPLSREGYELRVKDVQRRVLVDAATVAEAEAGIQAVRGAAGTIRTGLAVATQLEAANQEVVALVLPDGNDAVRAQLYADGTSALTAGNLGVAQQMANRLSELTQVFGEITVLAQRSDALLKAGENTRPDSAGEAELARLHKQVEQALSVVDPGRGIAGLAMAKLAVTELSGTVDTLSTEYTYRIVNKEGVKAGVWRYSVDAPNTKNYYLVVEAIEPNGQVATVRVRNEESGQTKPVKLFAVRVPESEYEKVKADKMDNGLVDKDVVGAKKRGQLTPSFTMPVAGGFITEW